MKTVKFGDKINKRLNLCLGYFDGLHAAHRAIIARAKADGNAAVLTYSDGFFSVLGRGSGLIYTLGERVALLAETGVEYCIVKDFDKDFKNMTAEEFFSLLTASYAVGGIYCGADFTFGAERAGNVRLLSALCGSAGILLNVTGEQRYDGERVSSTAIRGLIASGDTVRAGVLLDRPYSIGGAVVRGRGDGARMGLATANQFISENKLLPAQGVYVTETELDGKIYKSVTNIGVKPTFGDFSSTAETRILDYTGGELYGKYIRVSFGKFLRGIVRFDNIEQLVTQINKDITFRREINKI